MRLPLAANISTVFGEWEFLDRIDAAADAGFDAVECQFPYEFDVDRIAARLARAGLPMILINSPPGDLARGELGMAALPGREAEFRASIDAAIRYALGLRVKKVHVLAGRGAATRRAALAANLAWAADAMASRGLVALVEPLNPRDRPDYVLTDLADVVKLIAEAGTPGLKLQLDLYHWRMMGGVDFSELTPLLPVVGHVQVAAVPDRGEPRGEDVALLELLEGAGYRDPIGCEYVPRAGTREGLDWLGLVERSSRTRVEQRPTVA